MMSSSKRLLCFRCLIVLHSLMTAIAGKTNPRVMVKPLTTLSDAAETSSRSWNQFHVSPNSAAHRLTTSPADGSPRQPDADGKKTTPGANSSSNNRGIRRTRQVDPLQSCIEAKCSSWRSSEYLNCIYHHCINNMESSASRFGRDITGKMHRMRMQVGSQAERMLPGMKRGRLLLRDGEAEPLAPVVASVPGAFLSMDLPMRRRGFNDISDVCRERNCGPYQQNVEYFNCIENIADCPSLRR